MPRKPVATRTGLTARDVRLYRLGQRLTTTAFSKALGYSRGYVGNIEAGRQPVTRSFEQHFNDYRAQDGQTIMLNPPRSCACGCGIVFVGSPRQVYLNRQHQVRGYDRNVRRHVER